VARGSASPLGRRCWATRLSSSWMSPRQVRLTSRQACLCNVSNVLCMQLVASKLMVMCAALCRSGCFPVAERDGGEAAMNLLQIQCIRKQR
jgi:hypothetical protein